MYRYQIRYSTYQVYRTTWVEVPRWYGNGTGTGMYMVWGMIRSACPTIVIYMIDRSPPVYSHIVITLQAMRRFLRSLSSHRAIVAAEFGPPEVLKLNIVPMPKVEAGQVLVKMYAAGINPSDTYIRLGPHGPWGATPHLLPSLPFTPGKDGAGVIEAVGDGVTKFSPGDRIYTTGSLSGTLAEFALCAEDTVHPLPPSISYAQGACVGVPCATAYRALFLKAKVQQGDAVLIHGASGAVGLAAIQLAVAAGCAVVGTAGTAAGEAAVAALGASVVNHRSDGYLQAAADALPAAKDGKFDLVLEMAAHANLLADLTVLQRGARILIIGSKPQTVAFNPRLLMPLEATVQGVFLPTASSEEKERTHEELYAAMDRGELCPVVGQVLPLVDAPKAHAQIVDPPAGGKVGNLVLAVRDEDA